MRKILNHTNDVTKLPPSGSIQPEGTPGNGTLRLAGFGNKTLATSENSQNRNRRTEN